MRSAWLHGNIWLGLPILGEVWALWVSTVLPHQFIHLCCLPGPYRHLSLWQPLAHSRMDNTSSE